MNMARTLTVCATLLCVWATDGIAQQATELHPAGTYTQIASGMTFPVAVGEFQRVSVLRFVDDGSNESANYNLGVPPNGIAATVYVSPSLEVTSIGSPRSVIEQARATLCSRYFGAVQYAITFNRPGAALLSEGRTTLTQGDTSHSGYMATYSLKGVNVLGNTGEARSQLHVFCYLGGEWTVKFRFTYPVEFEGGEEMVAAFMRDLKLTIPPEK